MRGRYTAISFILFANIMLLVHALVPHHHHKGIICFTEEHSISVCDHHTQNHDSEKEDSGCCVVKQDYLVPTDEIGKTTRCVVNELNSKFQIGLFPLIISSSNLRVFAPVKFIHHFFDDLPLYRYYLSSSLSLRAPPCV